MNNKKEDKAMAMISRFVGYLCAICAVLVEQLIAGSTVAFIIFLVSAVIFIGQGEIIERFADE